MQADKAPLPCPFQEPMTAPKHMQDGSTAVAEQLETINLSDDPSVPKPISVSVHLTGEEREALVSLLKEFRDVFSWSYEEMPGLNPNLVSHTLNIELGTEPVVQPRRNFHPEIEKQIKVEIEKLLAAGFIKPIKHPTWLANIVPVKKKTGVIRVCTDYRDLNRACPKDEFPLPNMDILIDSTSGQGMLSFMDGFSGYNQIKMSPKDAEKTAFRTPYGNFYYTVMPFGLKNAGATYQRAMTAVFHDMMGKEVEDYVDDLVVKSRTRGSHQEVLRRVLERCRFYGLKMNPKKCAFGVSSGKFLGFQVHQRGIDVDSEKTKAICSLAPPKNPKELKSFMGRLSYIRRFIPGLAAMMSAFTPLLKKGKPYIWSQECQEAYQQVQQLITKLPTMKAPVPGLPLKLYLAATNAAVGALLAQDGHDGEESPIYYVSRQLRGAEARPVLSGRLARWLLQLSEFDITCATPKAIKGQAVIDMLALFPEVEGSALSEEVLGELPEMVATVTKEEPWTLYFDGSSTSKGGGAGVVLINPNGQATALSFKLDFPCTNNVAEYEAFIMGLSTAREMGAEKMKIIGDSNLVLSQLQGSFAVKEATLAPYRTAAERLINSFEQVVMEHIPGVTNRYADALATLGSKLSFVQKQPNITVIKRSTPVIEAMAQEDLLEDNDWRKPLKKKLGEESSIKDLKDYVIIFGELYRRLPGGVLTRCVGTAEARRRFGIPYKMVTDNGTPFVNKQVSSTISGYGIKHRRSTPYYPQGNGQAEATNKTILRILSKMVYEYQGSWSVHLPNALWAYRTSPRSATGFSPYSLVYGSEAISPVEITIPTARVAAVNDLEWDAETCSDWRLLDLEAADERRMKAERRMALYHKTVAQAYNRTVKPQAFKQGDLVLKVVEHVRRQVSGPSKFAPQWEGPFAVKEVHSIGYYRLISVIEGMLTDPINGKWLKPYYC
ncbi:unnamed protein product [Prunus brigantina]